MKIEDLDRAIQIFEDRIAQCSQMMRRLPRGRTDELYREARAQRMLINCVECRATEICASWLQDDKADRQDPFFCTNWIERAGRKTGAAKPSGLMGILRRLYTARSDRLDLMTAMFTRTNAMDGLLDSAHHETHLRSAMSACLGCRHASECHNWLCASRETKPPSFCANALRIRQFARTS